MPHTPRYHRKIEDGKHHVAEDGHVIYEAQNEADATNYLAYLARTTNAKVSGLET